MILGKIVAGFEPLRDKSYHTKDGTGKTWLEPRPQMMSYKLIPDLF